MELLVNCKSGNEILSFGKIAKRAKIVLTLAFCTYSAIVLRITLFYGLSTI